MIQELHEFGIELIVSACVAFFVFFPVYLIAVSISSRRKNKKTEWQELKQIAIDRGHVVTAQLIKIQSYSVKTSSSISNHESMGIYEYFYNGKRYKYTFQTDNPAGSLTLYFVDDPKTATVERALEKKGAPWKLIYLAVVLLVYLLMYRV